MVSGVGSKKEVIDNLHRNCKCYLVRKRDIRNMKKVSREFKRIAEEEKSELFER